MSDAGKEIIWLTREDYHALLGRLTALELLMGQKWVSTFHATAPERREGLIHDLLICLENRFDTMTPIEQRVAVDSAEGILTFAEVSCQVGEEAAGEEPGSEIPC